MEKSNLKLWYEKEAKEWNEAFPIGNGRLGAMVFGDVYNERIQLNEDTLWSGIPCKCNKSSLNDLENSRKLIFGGEYLKAEKLINEKLLGNWTQSYLPMANLYLHFYNSGNFKEYKRELDLNEAVVRVKYKINEVDYLRSAFISKIDNAIVINLKCSEKEKLNFRISIDSLLRFNTRIVNDSIVELNGKAPVKALPSYVDSDNKIIYDDYNNKGMNFKILVSIQNIDGQISSNNDGFTVMNSSEVTIKIVANTSFKNFSVESGNYGRDVDKLCNDDLKKIIDKSYEDMYKEHVNEYKKLFSTVDFSLGIHNNNKISTDKRIKNVQNGDKDLSLISLYFQYGRYLLISSSRKGTQPANLQGIWNEDLFPAWSSNYTTNINVEMNYWLAEVCNLSECHEPLLNMIKEISENGHLTAKNRYGCNGWTAHHNSDLWRQTDPALGSSEWAYWPMAGAWLCSHLWEHYDFTRDVDFLNRAYPIMKGAAVFMIDFLVEYDGYLVTCPSISPENNFLSPNENEKCSVSMSSTMDMSLIRNLFMNCIRTIDILKEDYEFKDKLEKNLKKLYPYKIGKHGQLQEWFEDFDEYEIGHRHLSHLFGLYPGREITESKCKEIYDACRVSLERRLSNGGGHTGWSCSWVISLFARLKDGNCAYKYLKVLLSKLTYTNLFNVCPPFQIDGNFGGTAAIAEMIIQSHEGYIEILPAIPDEWDTGTIKGLRARGNFEVDINWKDNSVTSVIIKSGCKDKCKIKLSNNIEIKNRGINVNFKENEGIVEFQAEKGEKYTITCKTE